MPPEANQRIMFGLKVILGAILFLLIIGWPINPFLYLYGTVSRPAEVINFPSTWAYMSFVAYKVILAFALLYVSGVFVLAV